MKTSYIVIFVLLILLSIQQRNKQVWIKNHIQRKKREGHTEMLELAKRFIEKECIVYSFDGGHQYSGVIKEVTDGAILVEKDGKLEALNLELVIRIREYPRKKNGKKKSVILD